MRAEVAARNLQADFFVNKNRTLHFQSSSSSNSETQMFCLVSHRMKTSSKF